MAISDTITSMYDNTSNAYDMLSNGTDLTGINKNLENLSSTIFEAFLEALRNPDTLFTNLPKTSGSGSQITLNNTANAPMRIKLNPTAISQDGTPTPDNPQDIHTISGNNSVVVEGKNLFNINNEHKVVINGSGTQRYGIIVNAPNKKVSFSATWGTGGSGFSYRLITNGEYSNYTFFNTNTTINVVDKIVFYVGDDNVKMSYVASNIQVEISDTPTTYTPYVSQTNPINLGEYELGTIGNYSNEFVRSNGKTNLFTTNYKTSDNLTTYTKIDNNSFSYTCSGTWKGATFVVPCEKNTDYFINYNEYNPNNRGTYCEVKGGQTNTSLMARYHDYLITFNSGENTSLKIAITNGNSSDNTSGSITCIMLNKGTTALPYVPYEKGWYYKQGIGKVVLDGTEFWGYGGIANVFYTTIITDYLTSNNIPKSNYFSGISNVTGATNMGSKDNNTIAFIDNWTNYRFYIKSSNFANETELKTWLSSNNTTCYYVLATPTYTKITGELAQELESVNRGMLSYDGTTNISQVNNDLAFVINASGILGE